MERNDPARLEEEVGALPVLPDNPNCPKFIGEVIGLYVKITTITTTATIIITVILMILLIIIETQGVYRASHQ